MAPRKKLPAASSSAIVSHARTNGASDAETESPTKKLLKKGRAKYQQAVQFGSKQRGRANEDRRFFAGEQWSDDVKSQRAGQEANNGLPPIPARPCLTVNLQREKVQTVENGLINADLGFELVPADDFAPITDTTDPEIEVREGLARRIQRNSIAEAARLWGAKNGLIAGEGWWLVNVKYLEGKTSDQEIVIEEIYDHNAIVAGPHKAPDGSDVEDLFVGEPMPWDEYREKFPLAAEERKVRGDGDAGSGSDGAQFLTDTEFGDFNKAYPEWFIVDEKGAKFVLVVRWWYYERTSRELAMFEDGSAEWVTDLSDEQKALTFTTRRVIDKTCHYADIDGARILEQGQWIGPDIPGVKYEADRLPPYDGEMRIDGMVRPSIDSQKGFNFMLSRGVEMVAVTPIPPLELDPEAIQGYEQWYWYANTRVLPYLPYRTRGEDGREFRPPARPNVEPNIQPVAAFFQVFRDAVQSTMSVHEPSVGKVDPRLKSGRAINAVVRQDEHGTSHYVDNYARSIHREAVIVNNLLFPVYGRPGRIAKMITREGDPQKVMINPSEQTTTFPPGVKPYQLTKDARFNIAMKVTKNSDLKRQQLAEFLAGIIEANAEMMAFFGDKFFEALDIPDKKELVERAKAMLAPQVQAMIAAKKQGIDVNALQQQLAQATGMVQQLSQVLEKQQREMEGDVIKTQGQMQIQQAKGQTDLALKQLEIQADIEKERMRNAAQIEVARIQAATKGVIADAQLKAKEEELATGIAADAAAQATTDASAAREADAQREHEATMQRDAHQHDAAKAASDKGHDADEAERGREHETSMGAMQHASAMEQTKAKAKSKPNGSMA